MADKLIYGADYNPDQWLDTPQILSEDLRLMDLARLNSATVAIFSWASYEPEEGKYDFSWLDKVLDDLHAHGKKVILATPSGARPAWLAQKYPEVLRVEESGVRNEYGVRHNHCLTSPVYREKTRQINEILAERYGRHPALLAWHISNEYSGECHCELCQNAFRDFLREEYHNDIGELNFKWWNGFWAHQVTSFEQISSPKYRGESHVPALRLAWARFVSKQHISFLDNEIAGLRKFAPDVPVTTNFMRLYKGIDYAEMAGHLDFVSWDSYPDWTNGDNTGVAAGTAFCHDLFRSLKHKPFYMMESTPSVTNWKPVNVLPRSGVLELGAVQALAHGADSVQYFQWRKSRGGHEKFHGAVVDHEGSEHTRVFRDAARLGQVLERLSGVAGEMQKAGAAVIFDWENAWAAEGFCGYFENGRDYDGECIKWYQALWEKNIPVDVVPSDADLSGYKLVIAPFLYMMKPGVPEKIRSYIENGGAFVSTYLFANVDRDDLCFLGGFPGGGLREVFGVWAEETDAIEDGARVLVEYHGKTYEGDTVADVLHAEGAETLGVYGNRFYKGSPALTVNGFGKGKAYTAAFRASEAFVRAFVGDLIEETGLRPALPFAVCPGVSAVRRGNDLFLMNFTDEEKRIETGAAFFNVASGENVGPELTLAPSAYVVLRV